MLPSDRECSDSSAKPEERGIPEREASHTRSWASISSFLYPSFLVPGPFLASDLGSERSSRRACGVPVEEADGAGAVGLEWVGHAGEGEDRDGDILTKAILRPVQLMHIGSGPKLIQAKRKLSEKHNASRDYGSLGIYLLSRQGSPDFRGR